MSVGVIGVLIIFSIFTLLINNKHKYKRNCKHMLTQILPYMFVIFLIMRHDSSLTINLKKLGISIKQNNLNRNFKSKQINRSKQVRGVTQHIKKIVASTQKWKCVKCCQLLDASYEIDHIQPLYQGGNNNIHNLQALCRNCHGKKTINDALSHQHVSFQHQFV
jgi:5-methylcytosine-specific restriction enzyme A